MALFVVDPHPSHPSPPNPIRPLLPPFLRRNLRSEASGGKILADWKRDTTLYHRDAHHAPQIGNAGERCE